MPVELAPARTRWQEPTRRLRLRWGNYTDRYLIGLVLIIGGGIQLSGSNDYAPWPLLIGTVAHAVGWSILPARGWRRIVAVGPGIAQIWLMLAGPLAVWAFSITYVCWLLVRHRPLRSYLTLAFPIANGVILPYFFIEYSGMLWAMLISMCVFIGAAWLARALATTRRVSA